MTETRASYRLTTTDNLHQLITELNFIFEDIALRLDILEGYKDPATIKNGLRIEALDDDNTLLHQFGNKDSA